VAKGFFCHTFLPPPTIGAQFCEVKKTRTHFVFVFPFDGILLALFGIVPCKIGDENYKPSTKGEKFMAEEARVVSIQPEQRRTLTECSWDDLNEPGTYVDRGSGDLYRVPKEALINGASPMIRKESLGFSRLVQLSKNPFVITFEARMLAAEHNIKPNF
jgi:hypothetical protein